MKKVWVAAVSRCLIWGEGGKEKSMIILFWMKA